MSAPDETYLHWVDYAVMSALLVASLIIGIFFAVYKGGQKTKADYLLGNRQMSMIPVCLSLFVTFQSAVSLIGAPADVFNTGTMVLLNYFGIALSYTVGCFTVVPLMYPLHVTSIYAYLVMRFDSTAVQLLVTCLGMLQTCLYMAVALFSPALVLQTAAGLPFWVSVAIVGGICTVYTAVGGIKSVVWTDVIQTVVVFIGMGAVIIMGTLDVGSISQVFHLASEGGRIIFNEISPDIRERHTTWSAVIGSCFVWLSTCFNQASVQRIGAMKTMKNAKIAFLMNVPLNILYGLALTLTGILLYAYVITIGCDPFKAGLITNRNQIVPYFVPRLLGSLPGMPGLYMSMLFSGALSTLSSGITALATNTVEDILARPLRGYKDTTVTALAKFIVLGYGAVTIGLAYLAQSLRGPVTQLTSSAYGACGGPVSGIFFMAGMVPWANKYGAIGGGLVGIAVNMWIAVGAQMYGAPIRSLPPGPTHNCFHNNTYFSSFHNFTTEELITTLPVELSAISMNSNISTTGSTHMNRDTFSVYDISYLWFGAIGFLITFFVGTIISFLTGPTDPSTLDPALVFPLTRKLFHMKGPSCKTEDISKAVTVFPESLENTEKSTGTLVVDVGIDNVIINKKAFIP